MFSRTTVVTQLTEQPSETTSLLSSSHHPSSNNTTNDTPSHHPHPDRYGIIQCPSSQQISYMEYGTRNGLIVFYFGATNFNHNACPDSSGVLHRLNVRFIIIDRPGYGDSTLIQSLNDSPHRFARNTFPHILRYFGCSPSECSTSTRYRSKPYLIGHQTGCIYVLSIASSLPSAIEEVALICPPTPYRDGPELHKKSILTPTDSMMRWCSLHCLWCVFWCHYRPSIRPHFVSTTKYIDFVEEYSPQSALSMMTMNEWKERYDEGSEDRMWTEWILWNAKGWGFRLDSIKTHCHLWYGTEDVMAPYSSWYESALSNVTAYRMEGYGHLLIYSKFDNIISSMIHTDL